MTDFPPQQGPTKVAPGMTFPVEAGQEYTLVDDKGEKLVIEGRDDPLVIGFLEAFDSYLIVKNTTGLSDDNAVIISAWSNVLVEFEALPDRVKAMLPSERSAGIVIPGSGFHEHS